MSDAVRPNPNRSKPEQPTPRLDSDAVVWCEHLSKRYGDFRALADCSLQVNPGDVFGLLGPNGAGKTTLIRSLLGFLHISSGRSLVCGHDPASDSVAVRRQVSYLPGDARLPRHMRGDGVLRFFAELHPCGDLRRSRQIAEALELDTRRRVGMMSTGMRQKLALAVVLAPTTPLLILDEPTANLDPTVRATVLEFVRQAHRESRTVMLSSHVLSEIEEVCNRVAFLRHGELVHELEMTDLYQRHRVWGEIAEDQWPDTSNASTIVPSSLRESVEVHLTDQPARSGYRAIRIDTAGDLSPMMQWIASLHLQRLRVEPLGLRAVYNSVHRDTLRSARNAPEQVSKDMRDGQPGQQPTDPHEAAV